MAYFIGGWAGESVGIFVKKKIFIGQSAGVGGRFFVKNKIGYGRISFKRS